jgi:putative ABC transport system permease protein
MRLGNYFENLIQDLRYGARMIRRSPGFSLVAVLTLALGIGANTAIFSVVDAVLLRALPYREPDRLVMVWEHGTGKTGEQNTPAPANYADWKSRNHVFTGMAATASRTAILTGDGPPEQLLGRAVTADFFTVLGVQPLLGRTFSEDEDRTNAPVAVISYRLWRRRYLGDPNVIGTAILMDGAKSTVIGVMPRDFVFRNREIDYWCPIAFSPAALANRGYHFLNVVARLKLGVTVERAREDMSGIARELARQYSENERVGASVVPLQEDLLGQTRIALLVLMAAAGCVLLIACANLASLLLARAVRRQREIAVRAALGAGRGRLARQMIAEGVLLSLSGGVLGVCAALGGMGVLARVVPVALGDGAAPQMDSRLLGFTLALSILTGLVFSIVPAVQAVRGSLHDKLQQGGRGGVGARGRGARDMLVIVEVAAALVLLVAAGLMLQTLARLGAIDIGFRSDHLLAMRTVLPAAKYRDPVKRQAFYERVLEGVRTLPGVEGAAYASTLPFLSRGNTSGYQIEGRTLGPGDSGDVLFRVTTNDYLKTLGARLLEGRLPNASDGPDSPPVVVINQTFARWYWPQESALGHRVSTSYPNPVWMTIVGVVADVYERGYELEMKPGVYVLTSQARKPADNLVIRAAGDPRNLAPAVRRIVASVDPEQPVAAVRTMDEIVALEVSDRRQVLLLLGVFAGLALLLASIGLYGVLAYSVTQRSREIGLRMALGATRGSVIRMVVGYGLALTAAGLAIGLAASWAVTRTMTKLLYGVQATDAATFAAVAALLGTVAAAACWIPARRASLLDPIVVLRED